MDRKTTFFEVSSFLVHSRNKRGERVLEKRGDLGDGSWEFLRLIRRIPSFLVGINRLHL